MPKALVVSHSPLARDPRVQRTINTLLEEGWKVNALVLGNYPDTANLSVTSVRLARKRGSALRYIWEYSAFFLATLFWIIRHSRKADLVFINSPPDALVFAALPARLRRIPIVLDVHDIMAELFVAKGNTSTLVQWLLLAQERWAAGFADEVITVHDPVKDLLESRIDGANFHVVMNVPSFDLPSVAWNSDSRVIVYTGSVAIRYGLDDLVNAMAATAGEIPDISLRILGEGEDLETILALSDRLGIRDRIDYRGLVAWHDVPTHLADAWVGFNVPKPDVVGELSFSNKVVEWTAMGLPVISGSTPTMTRYFPIGTLLYVEPGSSAAIAEQLKVLHTSPPAVIRDQIREAQAALQRISWPVQRTKLLTAINAALDS